MRYLLVMKAKIISIDKILKLIFKFQFTVFIEFERFYIFLILLNQSKEIYNKKRFLIIVPWLISNDLRMIEKARFLEKIVT